MPGHPYPVVEDHRCTESLLGLALQAGCQSHYVRTDIYGFVITKPDDNSFDEIVLSQENLVVPAFVLSIAPSEMIKLKLKLEKAMGATKLNPFHTSEADAGDRNLAHILIEQEIGSMFTTDVRKMSKVLRKSSSVNSRFTEFKLDRSRQKNDTTIELNGKIESSSGHINI